MARLICTDIPEMLNTKLKIIKAIRTTEMRLTALVEYHTKAEKMITNKTEASLELILSSCSIIRPEEVM